jgi:hypothetical protein
MIVAYLEQTEMKIHNFGCRVYKSPHILWLFHKFMATKYMHGALLRGRVKGMTCDTG